MKAGIYTDVSWGAYIGLQDYINASSLKRLSRSFHHLASRTERSSDAMELGVVTHVATLQPELLDTEIAAYDGVRRGAAWEAFRVANFGKRIVTQNCYEKALAVAKAVSEHPTAMSYLEGDKEVTLIAEIRPGLMAKGRLDVLNRRIKRIADLKTTQDASPSAFARTVINLHYHTSAAFYMDLCALNGSTIKDFVWVAVETEDPAPEKVAIYTLSNDLYELGRKEYRHLLDLYQEGLVAPWKGYPVYPQEVLAPAWALSTLLTEGLGTLSPSQGAM